MKHNSFMRFVCCCLFLVMVFVMGGCDNVATPQETQPLEVAAPMAYEDTTFNDLTHFTFICPLPEDCK